MPMILNSPGVGAVYTMDKARLIRTELNASPGRPVLSQNRTYG
ncbi:hypothetical protein R69658_06068 [Paraburkholderia aspalathi]|uniref:Uncharacterized protein n=1 Tax=Paraburkholderia aspalathi TaxID=1324617 RepID=A0ABM8SQM0_9BURK|nr:hypothetical protein R69658_06068 [Paraburkholderia aspalathi]